MEPYAGQVDAALRQGRVDEALAAAQGWVRASKSPSKEMALEIARTVGGVYRDLIADPVHAFVERADILGVEAAPVVKKAVGRLIDLTREWEPKLRAVYEERLARELRDIVRAKDWHGALERVEALCRPATEGNEGEREQRALYVANVLGTCVNHPRETDYLLRLLAKDPGASGLTETLVAKMQEAKDSRHHAMMGASLENLENQWSNQLKQTQVEILQAMPGKNKMGEPEEAELRAIGDLFRTVLRVPLWLRQSEMLVDATLILVDFVPKEIASTAKASGVEDRAYSQLGFAARKAVALVFMEIGKNTFFTDLYLRWAQDRLDSLEGGAIVELMGALRAEQYSDFFTALLNDKRRQGLRSEVAVALGNLASPAAADLLLAELQTTLGDVGKKRVDIMNLRMTKELLDSRTQAEAERLLVGLGRIVRSPRTDEKIRRTIITRAVSQIPEDSPTLAIATAREILAPKPEALKPEERRWAIATLVEALWIKEQTTDMHKGGERQANILGPRGPLAEMLKRLGKADLPTLVEELDKRANRYSGAYVAVAEIFGDEELSKGISGEKILPVLEKMILTALTFEEGKQDQYQKEYYWDATEQRRKLMTKDIVTAPLVHAIAQIGGPEAERILEHIHTQIDTGRFNHPGPDTMKTLAKFIHEKRKKDKSSGATATAGAAVTSNGGAAVEKAGVDLAEVKELVKELTSSHFLKGAAKKAELKIKALLRLGQITPPEALDAIFEVLGDKDMMVQNAAITTLVEYSNPQQPGYLKDEVIDRALDAFESKDPQVRAAAPKLLKAMGPNRPDVKSKLVDFVKTCDSSDVKHRLKLALQMAQASPDTLMDDSSRSASGADSDSRTPKKVMTELEKKRALILARQEWIRGGKQGPPPGTEAEE